jgi:hypothetical protein
MTSRSPISDKKFNEWWDKEIHIKFQRNQTGENEIKSLANSGELLKFMIDGSVIDKNRKYGNNIRNAKLVFHKIRNLLTPPMKEGWTSKSGTTDNDVVKWLALKRRLDKYLKPKPTISKKSIHAPTVLEEEELSGTNMGNLSSFKSGVIPESKLFLPPPPSASGPYESSRMPLFANYKESDMDEGSVGYEESDRDEGSAGYEESDRDEGSAGYEESDRDEGSAGYEGDVSDYSESLSQAVDELKNEPFDSSVASSSDSALSIDEAESGPITQDLSLGRFASSAEEVPVPLAEYAQSVEDAYIGSETPTEIRDSTIEHEESIIESASQPDEISDYASAKSNGAEEDTEMKADSSQRDDEEDTEMKTDSSQSDDEVDFAEEELQAIEGITNALCELGERSAPHVKTVLMAIIKGIWTGLKVTRSVTGLAYNDRFARIIILLLLLTAHHRSETARLVINACVSGIVRITGRTLYVLTGLDIPASIAKLNTWATGLIASMYDQLVTTVTTSVTESVKTLIDDHANEIKEILKEFASQVKAIADSAIGATAQGLAIDALKESFLQRMANRFAQGAGEGVARFAFHGLLEGVVRASTGGPNLLTGGGNKNKRTNRTRKNKSKPKKNYRKTQHNNKKKKITRRKHNKRQPKKRSRRIK